MQREMKTCHDTIDIRHQDNILHSDLQTIYYKAIAFSYEHYELTNSGNGSMYYDIKVCGFFVRNTFS